ncbi:hypothetical protein SLE2022_206680 [Rubroshorea leprosula]
MEAEYRVHRKWDYKGRDVKAYCSDWRKKLWKINKAIAYKEDWLQKGLEKVIGEGNEILFWLEEWCGKTPFREKFNRLYRLIECKEAIIKDMGEWRGREWVWMWKWSRDLLGHDLTTLSELTELLKRKNLKQRK